MTRITRVLAVSGLGLIAGLTLAGPARAASASTGAGSTADSVKAVGHWGDDDTEVVGYYRSLGACLLAGGRGERRGDWDDYDCDRERRGWYRVAWVLEVTYDDWSDEPCEDETKTHHHKPHDKPAHHHGTKPGHKPKPGGDHHGTTPADYGNGHR